jgi:hypothetical protein
MSFVPVGLVVVTLLFGSTVLGLIVARFLPEHHLSQETKNAVSVSMAVVGTLSALVVGLLISTTNATFNAKSSEVAEISTDMISLDRLLRRYGSEARDIHVLLRRYAEAKQQDLFPAHAAQKPDLANTATLSVLEAIQDRILTLAPANDTQRWLQAQALQTTGAIMAAHWQLVQEDASRTPRPLLVLVMFWFVVIFASFGLFAPCNVTSLVAILLCSVGIGSAIRMTSELQTPFTGLIRISGEPLAHAVAEIGG